jgi:hypothetical protein
MINSASDVTSKLIRNIQTKTLISQEIKITVAIVTAKNFLKNL